MPPCYCAHPHCSPYAPLIIGNYSPVWSTGSHRQSIWWTIWSLCCNSVWRHPGPEENNGRISHSSFHYRTCWLRLNQDEHVWFLYHKQNRIGKRLFWFRLGSIPNSNSTWNRKPRVSQAMMVHKHCNYWTDNLELFFPFFLVHHVDDLLICTKIKVVLFKTHQAQDSTRYRQLCLTSWVFYCTSSKAEFPSISSDMMNTTKYFFASVFNLSAIYTT